MDWYAASMVGWLLMLTDAGTEYAAVQICVPPPPNMLRGIKVYA